MQLHIALPAALGLALGWLIIATIVICTDAYNNTVFSRVVAVPN